MINRMKLNNGVRIVTEKIESVRSVSIGIWIGTGSRYEKINENGLSHFLEHMFFKGTKTRSAQEIAAAFDRIGGHVNAFTAKEFTCYYAKVLDEHASHALTILADMFFNSVFDEEELEKEKKVILEEIKMVDDTPDDIVHDLLSEVSYEGHALAYPILGTLEKIESFTSAGLADYMNHHYTGDHIVISLAGNVTEDNQEQVETIFSKIPKTTEKEEQQTPVHKSNFIVRKKDTEQAHLCLGYEGLPIGHDDMYALILLNNLLGGSMSSRLFQEIREKQGLCYSVYSYHSAYSDIGMLTLYAGTAHDQLDDLVKAIQYTVSELAENGINEEELRNGKEQLKGSLIMNLESTSSRMSRNGKNELLLKQHRTLDEIIDDINKVTRMDVNKLANRILSKRPSISLINRSGELPATLHSIYNSKTS